MVQGILFVHFWTITLKIALTISSVNQPMSIDLQITEIRNINIIQRRNQSKGEKTPFLQAYASWVCMKVVEYLECNVSFLKK